MADNKPSFLSSVTAGAMGMVKGVLALGLIGAIVGSAIGAVAGATGLIVVDAAATGMGATAVGALLGGGLLAKLGASLGGIAGAVTGVMQNREQGAVDGQDVVNIANIAFAQGMQAGRSKQVSEPSKDQVQHAADHFQKQLAAEKSNPSLVSAR